MIRYYTILLVFNDKKLRKIHTKYINKYKSIDTNKYIQLTKYGKKIQKEIRSNISMWQEIKEFVYRNSSYSVIKRVYYVIIPEGKVSGY